MLGSPVGRFCNADTNAGICAPSFCCIEVIDDESSIMNRTSSLPGLVPVAAAVTAAGVDSTGESTFGWAHDAADSPRAIATPATILEAVGTNLGEKAMMSPCSGVPGSVA